MEPPQCTFIGNLISLLQFLPLPTFLSPFVGKQWVTPGQHHLLSLESAWRQKSPERATSESSVEERAQPRTGFASRVRLFCLAQEEPAELSAHTEGIGSVQWGSVWQIRCLSPQLNSFLGRSRVNSYYLFSLYRHCEQPALLVWNLGPSQKDSQLVLRGL